MYGFRQSLSKVLGQMPQIYILVPNANPPGPFSMLDHIEHLVFACHGVCIENTTLIGVGEGEG